MPNRPQRIPEFSYRGPFQYFLTVCVRHRRPIFADHALGLAVIDQFLRIADQEHFAVIAYCVMPDHFHALVEGLTNDADLRRMMHRWKLCTGHWWQRLNGTPLWQEGFFDHVLRDEDPVPAVVRYIVANPIRAGIVENVMDYPLTGSGRYVLGELIDASLDWKPRWRR